MPDIPLGPTSFDEYVWCAEARRQHKFDERILTRILKAHACRSDLRRFKRRHLKSDPGGLTCGWFNDIAGYPVNFVARRPVSYRELARDFLYEAMHPDLWSATFEHESVLDMILAHPGHPLLCFVTRYADCNQDIALHTCGVSGRGWRCSVLVEGVQFIVEPLDRCLDTWCRRFDWHPEHHFPSWYSEEQNPD